MRSGVRSHSIGHVGWLFSSYLHIGNTGNPLLKLTHVEGLTRRNAFHLLNRLEVSSQTSNLLQLLLPLSLSVGWSRLRKLSVISGLSVARCALKVDDHICAEVGPTSRGQVFLDGVISSVGLLHAQNGWICRDGLVPHGSRRCVLLLGCATASFNFSILTNLIQL